MVYVSGLLFKNIDELQVGGELSVKPPLPAPLDRTARLFRDSVVCSNVPDLAGCRFGDRQFYRDLLRDWFIINLFATVLLLVVGLRALHRWLQPRVSGAGQPPVVLPVWGFLSALLGFALLLDLFALPFTYARTIKQASFPTAVIALKNPDVEAEAESSKGMEAQRSQGPEGQGPVQLNAKEEKPAGDDQAQAVVPPLPTADQLWQILSFGENRFVVYNKSKAQVWSIPNEMVRIVRIRNKEDVLESYLLRKMKEAKP
jgi:hypothetical protein